MKNKRLFFSFLAGTMLILPITAVALKDPNYSQTPPSEGALVESTIPAGGDCGGDCIEDDGEEGAISIPMAESAATPSYSPPPPPSAPQELQTEVLGVSTERDHTEEYFQELKSEIGTLRAAAEKTIKKEEVTLQFEKNRLYQNVMFVIFAVALAALGILSEIRYAKTSKLLESKKKFRKKRVK